VLEDRSPLGEAPPALRASAGYLGFLATRLPARMLFGMAARRATRLARARLLPAAAAPTQEQLLRGLGCDTPADLAGLLASRPAGLVTSAPPAELARALERWFPDERDRLLARARSAADGRIDVFGRAFDVRLPGGGTDWQLDPIHGGRFSSAIPSSALPSPRGLDVKMAWELGRGSHWVALGCGAVVAPGQASRFAEAFAASVRDFVAANPVGRGAQWASPMEVALRAVCLSQAHGLLAGNRALADPGFALDLARLVVASGRFVLANLEDGQAVPNNHLVADWLGLLACALFLPEWPEAARWRELARSGLARELQAQTHPDGTSFEGSVPYHRLALEMFTAGALLCRAGRLPLGGAYRRRLAAMYQATRALLSCDGALPQIGDNDSGRVVLFRERAPLDGGYLLPLGAAVLGDPALRTRPGAADAEEVLWLCGPAALARLAQAPSGPPPGSASFPDGGFHVLRRGSLEAAISCGGNGQRGIGGHSHNDKLALELRVGGELVIADPGTFCYTGDPVQRNLFRSTRAHATVTVDGQEQSPFLPGRLFALPDAAAATALVQASSANGAQFVGQHRGYERLGVLHRREVRLGGGALIAFDHLLGDAVHAVALRWPFPSAEARVRPLHPEERARLQALGPELTDLEPLELEEAVEIGPSQAPLAVLVCTRPPGARLRLVGSRYSPGYGSVREAANAVIEGRVQLPITLVTVLLTLRPGESDAQSR